ncbi:dihydrolipoyl dehydrogenase [Acidicapsa dinghuensis]|uniref:Dihydrolipoyl dehydrogenase n=1 Tax=Acidicapsa dinghuensis TaxID=2218256 RepID=A0ABW1EL53_9BACT|nr:dihydrolipoyl dehydrogenase [Acidicapsa dinghuensis]
MPETIYDVAIIGSGPAGYTAAIRAGEFGLKVALIEKNDQMGGTCLHVGCIPTKALLFHAEVWDHLKHAADYGIDNVTSPQVNWPNALKRKNAIIQKHVKGLEFLMRKNKVNVIEGYGRLTGPAKDGIHTVSLYTEGGGGAAGEQTTLQAKNIIVATGSEAKLLPGLEADTRILTNIEILSMADVPKSLIVIGAGAVGVEFSSIFRSFGSEVTIIEYLPRLVPVEDEEISKELTRQFKKRGIDVNTGAKVESVEKTETGVKVTWIGSNGKQQVKEAEKVLIAVGRAPRIGNIDIDKTKIELDRGFIKTGEAMETAEPGIFAIGDIVAGMPQLAHSGAMAGMVAVAKIAGKPYRPIRRDRIPGCTYTEPQIGSVGLTEAAAKEKGHEVKVGKFPFAGNSKATIVDSHDGFVKIVSDTKYGEILGVHIIGPQATEIISEAVVAMDLEGTVDELMYTIHAHPTLSESMLDAYGAVNGLAINA